MNKYHFNGNDPKYAIARNDLIFFPNDVNRSKTAYLGSNELVIALASFIKVQAPIWGISTVEAIELGGWVGLIDRWEQIQVAKFIFENIPMYDGIRCSDDDVSTDV